MDLTLVIGLVVGVVAVIVIALVAWIVVARAGLVRADRDAASAWADVEQHVRDRGAIGDDLVATAAAAAKPDLAAIEAARSALAGAAAATTPGEVAAAEPPVAPALRAIAGIAGGKESVASQAALAAAEDAIQSARRAYNHSVREVQRRARRFPGSLFSRSLSPRDFFEVDAAGAVAEPPRIRF